MIWIGGTIGATIGGTIGRLYRRFISNLYIPVCHTNRRSIKNMIGVVVNRLVGMTLNSSKICVKPVFHRILRLGTQRNQKRDKQHLIYMPNANPALAYPMRTMFHWLKLVVWVGDNANFSVCVGGNANFSVFRC